MSLVNVIVRKDMLKHMVLLEPRRLELLTPGPLILGDVLGGGSLPHHLLLNVPDGFEQLILLDPAGDGEEEVLRPVELPVVLPHLLHGGGVPHVLQLPAGEGVVARVARVELLLQGPGAGGGVPGALDLAVDNPRVVAGSGDVVNLRDKVLVSQGGKQQVVKIDRQDLKEPFRED